VVVHSALASFVLAGIGSSRILLIALGIAGIGATLTVVPVHFIKAWRKVNAVPNKREYTVWVGFEMVCACGFFLTVIWATRS
jgi:hypothetical protein